MDTKSGPLEKKVTLRMDEELFETLKIISKRDKKLNQSQMVREALNLWINLRINREFFPDSDLCVISKNMLRLALDSMNNEAVNHLSEIAFENSKISRENMEKILGEVSIFQKRFKDLDNLGGRIAGIIDSVYGPTGYRWFDEITYRLEDDKVKIKGTHRLGNHFTRFFRNHINNNLREFGYEVESMQVTYVERNDNTREDRVEVILSHK